MVGKSLTQKMVIKIHEMYVEREMIGNVIWVNCCHAVAPSIRAASYTESSTLASAALVISIMKGKLTQTLKMQTVILASRGSARKSGVPKPSALARVGSGLSAVATR